MTIGERINLKREENHLTLRDVAEKIGCATQTIYKYENNIVTNIPLDKIEAIAKALDTTPAYLMGWDREPTDLDYKVLTTYPDFVPGKNHLPTKGQGSECVPITKGIKIPVLGKVVAGVPIDAVEEILDYEEITQEMASQGEHFALQVKGDSMEPRISDGDIVIFRKQSDVDTGNIAVVLVNGDEATIKKIKKRPDGIMLIPTNPEYEVMFYSNQEIEQLPVRIIGRAIELRAKI